MSIRPHTCALLLCLAAPGPVTALARDEGVTVTDKASGQAVCTTHVGPAPTEDGAAGQMTWQLRPGEQARLALESWFRIGVSASGGAWRTPRAVEANWRVAPAPGSATPDAGRASLVPATREAAGPTAIQARFEVTYTAPATVGLYGVPVRVLLDEAQAGAARIPEPCRVAATELAVLVGSGDGSTGAEYLFTLNGFYAGAGLARAGAANRGTFRVDDAGKIHGEGSLDLWLDGQCFRSRERQALRVEGWREGEQFHLRLHESGPREKVEDWTSQELRCFLIALEEAGSLLTQAVADLSMGEVTFKAVAPGEEHRFSPDDNWSASIRGLRR